LRSPGTDCFFFGSLREKDLLAQVLGRPIANDELRPASLPGFCARRVKGASYPGLRRAVGGKVPGVLFRPRAPAEISRLCWYEGSTAYRLSRIRVCDDAGRYRLALAFRPGRLCLTGVPWHIAHWRRQGKRAMLARIPRWMAGWRADRRRGR